MAALPMVRAAAVAVADQAELARLLPMRVVLTERLEEQATAEVRLAALAVYWVILQENRELQVLKEEAEGEGLMTTVPAD